MIDAIGDGHRRCAVFYRSCAQAQFALIPVQTERIEFAYRHSI